MTDEEIIRAQRDLIEKLQRKIKRLEKRLVDKKRYEAELLLNTGATPRFIAEVDAKDQKVLSS
jgi:hypothetical protein